MIAPETAANIAAIGQEGSEHMGALFRAIQAATDTHSEAYKLAALGAYLADDYGNSLDCEREEYARMEASQ